MLCPLISILAFAALSVAAFGLGRPLLRWIGVANDDRLTTVTFGVGLGLTVAGLMLLTLALFGIFRLSSVVAMTAFLGFWGLAELGVLGLGLEKTADVPLFDSPSTSCWPTPHRWILRVVLAAAAVLCLVSLLAALTPPTTGTTVSSHLESAKRLTVEGRIADAGQVAAAEHSVRPLLVEVWYAWALTLDGAVCAQLVHWGLGLLLAMATATIASPLLGRRWAVMAGGLVLLTPAINQQMGLSAESVALAAFCTLALAAWCQAVLHGGDRGWFVVAGLIAGGALGIHWAAALLVLPLAIGWAVSMRRHVEQRRFLLQGGTVAALVALSVGTACHLPVLLATGASFGLAIPNPSNAAWPDCVGVVLLAAAPGAFLVRRLRGLGMLLWTAAAYVALTVLLRNDPRLLFPAVPLLSVAAVWVWIELRRFPEVVRWFAAIVLTLAAACNMALSLGHAPKTVAVALGLEDREDYLLRHDPTYRAAAVANQVLRCNAHILSQEPRAFYFDCHVTRESSLRPTAIGGPADAPVSETIFCLRNAGFTHLLLTDDAPEAPSATHLRLQRVAETICPLDDYCFRTANGGVRRYRLVSLR